ncbi:MAG: hypothetical protein JW843_02335 [Candidatus Aminicenantes bacterium]|nr:hypothetical protein [Candidatus Aminicenantes bacterium]
MKRVARSGRIVEGISPLLLILAAAGFLHGDIQMTPSNQITLPETVGEWKRESTPRRIDESNIFEYMNGGGELYLSYHFDHLLVYTYRDGSENEILVEVYFMKEPRDAFGLLSLDWGGETVEMNEASESDAADAFFPAARALYGEGLLRACAGRLYLRIMAARNVPGVKDVILSLGRFLAAGREKPSAPEFIRGLSFVLSSWSVRRDRTAYFYNHLVLNSLFYLSHENILDLGPSTEAVHFELEHVQGKSVRKPVRLLMIRYEDADRASRALEVFRMVYLPDKKSGETPTLTGAGPRTYSVEDGWMGFRRMGRRIALVFACPDRESALEILERGVGFQDLHDE